MFDRRLFLFLTVLVVAVAMVSSACKNASIEITKQDETNQSDQPFFSITRPGEDPTLPLAVCTTPLGSEIVKVLAGDRFRVDTIVAPGRDPHEYRPRLENSVQIRDAAFVVGIGRGFETRMVELLDLAGFRAVMLAENPALKWIDPKDPSPNPHVWWSVPNYMAFVVHVRESLLKLAPQNAESINARADAYLEQLKELHEKVKEAVALIPEDKRVIVTAHDGLRSFGQEYGFDTYGVLGLHTQMQLADGRLDELAKIVGERKIPAVFLESACSLEVNENVRQVARLVKEQYGYEPESVGSVYTDTLDPDSRVTGHYIGAVKANIIQFVHGLAGVFPSEYFMN